MWETEIFDREWDADKEYEGFITISSPGIVITAPQRVPKDSNMIEYFIYMQTLY